LDTDSYSLRFRALDRLARSNTDAALAGLKKGMATHGADIGNRRDNDELGEQLPSNIRNKAAHALARSPHAEARRLMLTFWNDPDKSVRLVVLHVLGRTDKPESLELIKKMTADENEMIRGKAERYLELRNKQADDG
jgi:HEAT repeat protein